MVGNGKRRELSEEKRFSGNRLRRWAEIEQPIRDHCDHTMMVRRLGVVVDELMRCGGTRQKLDSNEQKQDNRRHGWATAGGSQPLH